jgi:hypothetical protein
MVLLYRLDYCDGDQPEAVLEPLPWIGGDLIARHMKTARTRAIERAAKAGRPIQISRISGAGLMKPTLIVEASGRCRRPPTSEPMTPREDCVRDSGRACFCSPCRAERRDERG